MSTAPKFTPGPWRANDRSVSRGRKCLAVVNLAMEQSEACANARLIAAAPELYEAVRNLLGTYETEHGEDAPDAIAARAALAKVDV